MTFYKWSKTAASNSNADATCPWPEGMAPSQVNDSARGNMAAEAKYRDDTAGSLTTAGSSTAYTVTTNQVYTSLADLDGQELTLRFDEANGSSPTLSVDGLAAKPLQSAAGTAIVLGMIAANSVWTVTYDNANNAFLVRGVPAVLVPTTGVDLTLSGHLSLTTTDYMALPAGTTAQRPGSPAAAQFRYNSTTGLLEAYSGGQWNDIAFGLLQPFQCQLVKDGTDIRLNRYAGKYVFIDGIPQAIPSGGVAKSPSGLIANTSYYVYVYMDTGTMTLEASTTAPAIDSTNGHKIKNGDATRSLVGQARTNGSIAWVDSATQRFVRSYYNDPGVTFVNTFSTTRSTNSTSFVELNSEIRVEGMFWADDIVHFSMAGAALTANDGDNFTTAFGIDGTSPETPQSHTASVSSRNFPLAASLHKSGLSDGYHYATILAKVSNSTATWLALTSLSGSVRRC